MKILILRWLYAWMKLIESIVGIITIGYWLPNGLSVTVHSVLLKASMKRLQVKDDSFGGESVVDEQDWIDW